MTLIFFNIILKTVKIKTGKLKEFILLSIKGMENLFIHKSENVSFGFVKINLIAVRILY